MHALASLKSRNRDKFRSRLKKHTMIKAEMSVVINRPVAGVFAFVTEPANHKKWQEGVIESRRLSSGPMGVGSQMAFVRKFLGRKVETKVEVTGYEPNKMFSAKTISGPLKFEMSQTYEPNGDGTEFSLGAQGEAGGFFKLAEGMVQKQMQSQLEGDLQRIKKMLEG